MDSSSCQSYAAIGLAMGAGIQLVDRSLCLVMIGVMA